MNHCIPESADVMMYSASISIIFPGHPTRAPGKCGVQVTPMRHMGLNFIDSAISQIISANRLLTEDDSRQAMERSWKHPMLVIFFTS